jgi:NNP family nitrate/nitrite transporter-like MFS transporter
MASSSFFGLPVANVLQEIERELANMSEVEGTSVRVELIAVAKHVKGSRWCVLVVICVVMFMASSPVAALSVTSVLLDPMLNLSSFESIALVSSPLVTNALLSLPATALSRNFGGRIISSALCFIASAGLASMAAVLQWGLSLSFGHFFVFGILFGCGPVVFNTGILTLTWWWPGQLSGTVTGLYLFVWCLGPGVFGAFVVPFIDATSFALVFLLWGVLLAFSGVAMLVFVQDAPSIQFHRLSSDSSKEDVELTASLYFEQDVFPVGSLPDDLKEACTSISSWCLVLISSLGSISVYLAQLVYLPTFFIQYFTVSSSTAGYILFGFAASASVSFVVFGWLIDKVGKYIWLVGFMLMAVSVAAFAILAGPKTLWLSIVASILAAISTAGVNALCFKMVPKSCHCCVSGCIGLMEAFGNLFGFVLPLIYGTIGSSLSMIFPTVTISICILVGVALFFRTWQENMS